MAPPNIPLIYRLFLLYIEPFFLVPMGMYLAITNPPLFILGTTPTAVALPYQPSGRSTSPITPLHTLLLTNTVALYSMFAINEALVLRLTTQLSVWRAMVFAILLCDFGHLYGMFAAAPEAFWDVGGWTQEVWTNSGILAAGAVLRICFLAGVGFRKGAAKRGKGN